MGESGRPAGSSTSAFPETVGEAVLDPAQTLGADAPAFQRTVADVSDRLRATQGVSRSSSPTPSGGRHRRSPTTATPPWSASTSTVTATAPPSGRSSTRHCRETKAAQKAHPEVRVEQFGDVSSEEAFNEIFERDMKKAGSLSLPLTLILLIHLRDGHRGRHPAAARDDGGRGDDGPRRPAQPPVAGRGLDQPRDPAHRPGRWRRLRAVLPAPRARGASRRTQQRSRASRRRRPRPGGRCSCPASR